MNEFHHVGLVPEQNSKDFLGMPQSRLKPLSSVEWCGIRRHLDELSSLREAARRQPSPPNLTTTSG